jgi:hypothetical protein
VVNDTYTNLLKVHHHNVQSLQNTYELSVLLAFMDTLCYMEYVQLVSNFSRSTRKGGGSCISVNNG